METRGGGGLTNDDQVFYGARKCRSVVVGPLLEKAIKCPILYSV